MRHVLLAGAIACITFAAAAQSPDNTSTERCDRLAASPTDANRPTDVPGTRPDKIDPKEAIPACEAAANSRPEDPRIAFQLGRAYFAAKAYESARAQFEKASNAGYAPATHNFAIIYFEGLGVAADRDRAVALLTSAAIDGFTLSMNTLATLYEKGDGVPKNIREAKRWWEKAGAAGDATAMNALGNFFETGNHGSRDYSAARRWFEKAAELGNASAMYNLGRLFDEGLGGPRNYAEAGRLYGKAAAAGDEAAMNDLGVLYFHGRGVPRDRSEAKRLWEKAAAAGNKISAGNLAKLKAAGSRPAGGARYRSGGTGGGDGSRTCSRFYPHGVGGVWVDSCW
jgi:TPR repeat protein